MEFVSCGHFWLTPSVKKSPPGAVDPTELYDLFAEGVKQTPAGHSFHF